METGTTITATATTTGVITTDTIATPGIIEPRQPTIGVGHTAVPTTLHTTVTGAQSIAATAHAHINTVIAMVVKPTATPEIAKRQHDT